VSVGASGTRRAIGFPDLAMMISRPCTCLVHQLGPVGLSLVRCTWIGLRTVRTASGTGNGPFSWCVG
jgi:hypothetical protein